MNYIMRQVTLIYEGHKQDKKIVQVPNRNIKNIIYTSTYKWNPPKILTFLLNDTYIIPIEKLKSQNKIFTPIKPLYPINYEINLKF
jgi:hypothetical protein